MKQTVVSIEDAKARLAQAKALQFAVAFTYLRIAEVTAITGLGKSTVYQLAKDGHFPKPYALTPNGTSVAWRSDELAAWMESRECA